MRDVALVRVQGSGMIGVAGFSSRLFGCLARRKINIILITQASSEHSICFAVLPKDAAGAAAAIREEFEREIASLAIDAPAIEKDVSIIAVVGSRMKSTPGIAGKVFYALGRNGVNVVAIAQARPSSTFRRSFRGRTNPRPLTPSTRHSSLRRQIS
jgi:aspartokinase/homoserine dehydrogenase 1